MLNNFSPLPLNEEPLFISIPPLTNNEPVNCEPLSFDSTLNPASFETDAVTEPLANKPALIDNAAFIESCASGVNAANGISNKLIPLPLNEPV